MEPNGKIQPPDILVGTDAMVHHIKGHDYADDSLNEKNNDDYDYSFLRKDGSVMTIEAKLHIKQKKGCNKLGKNILYCFKSILPFLLDICRYDTTRNLKTVAVRQSR